MPMTKRPLAERLLLVGPWTILLGMMLLSPDVLHGSVHQQSASLNAAAALETDQARDGSLLTPPGLARLPSFSLAQSRGRDFEDHYEQWQRLSPKEQRDLRQKYQRWQDMSPRERHMYRRRHHQWQQLPTKQRQELKRKLDHWDSLPAWEKERIRRQFLE